MAEFLAENPLESIIDLEDEPDLTILSYFAKTFQGKFSIYLQFDVKLAPFLSLIDPMQLLFNQ